MTADVIADPIVALDELLLSRGLADAKTMERARRVAAESGQRLDSVLMQLGLVSERTIANCFSELLQVPLADPTRFPLEPILPERLRPKFLRKARALPAAVRDGTLVLAMADPLDNFTLRAASVATGLPVAVEVALPIDLDAALNRLYPNSAPVRATDPERRGTDGGRR